MPLRLMPGQNGPFARTIEERITWAGNALDSFGPALEADPETVSLAARFGDARRASRREPASADIAARCGLCDREEGGSCCGAGIELNYDGWLLLINLFLGIRLPRRRARPGGCFFLGEDGCVLAARHVLCINYLCRAASEKAAAAALLALRGREGLEIEILFRLNEHIKRVVQSGAPLAVNQTAPA